MFHHSRLNKVLDNRIEEFTWLPFFVKILATSFMVNFLEPEEPSIYGYGYAPRYISELVANQGSSVKTLQ